MFKGSNILKHQAKIFFRSDCILRSKHSNEGSFKLNTSVQNSSVNNVHQSQATDYPATKALPLPLNIEDLSSSEKLKFSPQKSRDINGSFILSSASSFKDFQSDKKYQVDNIIECYDCSGVINLSSAMETNVPFPFVSRGKPVHLNMLGEQWGQKEKYLSEELNNVHPINSRQPEQRNGTSCSLGSKVGTENFYFSFPNKKFHFNLQPSFSFIMPHKFRNFCSIKEKVETTQENLNKNANVMKDQKQKFKTAVKEYGSVFIVYHISISLIFLGCCYVAVSSGIDLTYIIKQYGADDGAAAVGTAANFVIAYTVHKIMAPVRLAWSLATVPFVVKKLRKIGILKKPPSKLK